MAWFSSVRVHGVTMFPIANAPFTQDGDLCATFERPKNGQDAQWSPNRRKSCFYVTAPATREAEASPRLTGKFAAERIDYLATIVPPFCNHGNVCASLLPPLSHLWATNLLGDLCGIVRLFWTCSKIHGDHGVHGDVWTSCVPPLNDLGNHSATFEPPTTTWQILWSHTGGTKIAILCKGGISDKFRKDAVLSACSKKHCFFASLASLLIAPSICSEIKVITSLKCCYGKGYGAYSSGWWHMGMKT